MENNQDKYQPTKIKQSLSAKDALLQIGKWSLGTIIVVFGILPIVRIVLQPKDLSQQPAIDTAGETTQTSGTDLTALNSQMEEKCIELKRKLNSLRVEGASYEYVRSLTSPDSVTSCSDVGIEVLTFLQ